MDGNSALKNIALLISMGANIFFVAFFMGKMSGPPLPPSNFPPGKMMLNNSPNARFSFPPELKDGAGYMVPDGQFPMKSGAMPPPPPMFRPDDLFSPREMKDKFSEMEETFEKIEKARIDFAAKLETGRVSKEQVLKHFEDIDKVMNAVRTDMQEKAAEKIGGMSDEERKRFGRRLKEQRSPFEHPLP